MASEKQSKAAKQNIKKAQDKWKSMSSTQHSTSQPEGRGRKEPGTSGEGKYYRVVIRPKDQFQTFRYHDVGDEDGDLQRLSGKRQSGSWDTQAWLINKKSAHVDGDRLIPDTDDVRDLLGGLGSTPTHKKGDIWTAKPTENVVEKDKPTSAQKRAQRENIEKAQHARASGA